MSALCMGRFTPEQTESVRMALSRAGMSMRTVSDVPAARRALKDPHAATKLMLVDAAIAELEPLLSWIRSEAALAGLIVVAIAPAANEGAYAEAHAMGCDDVVLLGDHGAITRRAAALAGYDPTARPPATAGRAIVAHPALDRRRLIGRTLRLAGFDVLFAESSDELEKLAAREKPAIVIASDELPTEGTRVAIARARAVSGDVPVIIVGTRDHGIERAGLISEHAPPDHLLFVANELLRPGVSNLRASPRILHDALCAYRPAGEIQPMLGLTYNLSRGGLYVRTLDPPAAGTSIWFELRPPGERECVHLRGQVMWARTMERGPGGASPAGFGVRIARESCPPEDLARYEAAFDALR